MYHPSRGGVRGGQDQFDWEDVKADKYRENYLGHSVKAPVGRWQKGKDLHWYTKGGKADSAISKQQEKDAIKKMEAEALAIALGKGNVKKKASGVSKQELAEVCRKGQLERDSMDIERVEGMGFGSSRARLMDVASAPVKETLGATGSQEVDIPVQGSKANEKEEIQRDKDKTKRKKGKKDKKSKKDKKHKKKQYSDDEVKESKRRKRKHDHDELDKYDNKNAKYERKRSHNHGEHKKNLKRKRHDSSESESSDEKGKSSRKRFDPSTEGNSGKAVSKNRIDERPKERRQRHDTE